MRTPIFTRTSRRIPVPPRHEGWKCACGKLLGRLAGDRVHIRLERRTEYVVSRPVTATCRSCGTMNELPIRNRDARERR